MKKFKILIPCFVVVLLAVWFFNREEVLVNEEIEKIVQTESFPTVVRDQFKKPLINENEYSEKIKAVEGNSKFHHQLGENLYNIALGRLYYSEDKLKVLKMAKVHLMYAKHLGAK